MQLKCGNKIFELNKKPIIMGILNVSPESFSDGNEYPTLSHALKRAENLIEDGANIIDIGGESTAPGRHILPADEEIKRVIPVVKALVKLGIKEISIDTKKSAVASAALSEGTSWINDQSAGLFDNDMAVYAAKADAYVIMHHANNMGVGVDAGEHCSYKDLIPEIKNFFAKRITNLENHGVTSKKIIIDPGFGFGKGLQDSVLLLKNIGQLKELNMPILVGLSRKSFLGKLFSIYNPKDRDTYSMLAQNLSIKNGANIVRTHNVKMAVQSTNFLRSFA